MSDDSLPFQELSPSEIMRMRRPEIFSDSNAACVYKLSRPQLSHQLATVTERNEHHAFQEFCRALAQREICRNLRPQTGPEGGGDGKIDGETYPVSDEVRTSWFVGTENSTGERWAFACSAKKDWSSKVRNDVRDIVSTQRGYKKVLFFTNQNPSEKKRLVREEALTKEFGVAVTIYDRNWIETRVLEHGHHDLAYDFLKVGEFDPDAVRTGELDTYRQNELSDIEQSLAKPDKSKLSEFDSVSEALRAAQLSRGLERPQTETDGRFERAKKLARKHGTRRQQFVATYEHAWTDFWWFDDIDRANAAYDELEVLALSDGTCFEFERLGNLLFLFLGEMRRAGREEEDFKYEARCLTVRSKLVEFSEDSRRPNHALYSETLLSLHDLSDLMRKGESDKLDPVWDRLLEIVEKAKNFGEYPADLLSKMQEVFSKLAPDNERCDELIVQIAQLMGARTSDFVRGEILLQRGREKLLLQKPIDAISWLGRSVLAFNKKEYQNELAEALCLLTLAYRSAGLLWAARSTSLASLVSLQILADDNGRIEPRSIPVAKLFFMINLQLGYTSDTLLAAYLHSLFANTITLNDEQKDEFQSSRDEMDKLLACSIMALNKSELSHLYHLPDFFDQLEFYACRTLLLHRLGHKSELRRDGSIPESVSDEEYENFISFWSQQPATAELNKKLVQHRRGAGQICTTVLGVAVEFSFEESDNLSCAAEMLASALEGMSATLLKKGVFPHTPSASVILTNDSDKLFVSSDPENFVITIGWPESVKTNHGAQSGAISELIVDFFAQMIAMIAVFKNFDRLFDDLFDNEKIFQRGVMFTNSSISHDRLLGKPISRLEDLPFCPTNVFPITTDAPDIEITPFAPNRDDEESASEKELETQNHTEIRVVSLINKHLWDRAHWQGTAFFVPEFNFPPIIGLMFEDDDAGIKIFEQLIQTVGMDDTAERIRLSIILGVDASNPLNYTVYITESRKTWQNSASHPGQPIFQMSRMTTMTPDNHSNLNRFLSAYEKFGCFYFVPTVKKSGLPDLHHELRILKRELHVTDAWRIDSQHEDAMSLHSPELAVVPPDQAKPPIRDLILAKNKNEELLKSRGN